MQYRPDTTLYPTTKSIKARDRAIAAYAANPSGSRLGQRLSKGSVKFLGWSISWRNLFVRCGLLLNRELLIKSKHGYVHLDLNKCRQETHRLRINLTF